MNPNRTSLDSICTCELTEASQRNLQSHKTVIRDEIKALELELRLQTARLKVG